MTRAHVRLLGPCFKTGPKSTQSSSVADRYRAGDGGLRHRPALREASRRVTVGEQRARTGDGARSVTSELTMAARLRRARRIGGARASARVAPCGLIPCEYRRAAGRASEGLPRAVLPATRQAPHSGRRPTPSGSRRSTRGEVHDDVAGRARTVACPRKKSAGHRPPTRSRGR